MIKVVDWDTFSLVMSDDDVELCVAHIGRAVFAFSMLEIQVGRTIAAVLGLHTSPTGDAVVGTIDAINKLKMINGIASIYRSDTHGVVEDYKPRPDLAARLKSLAKLFEGLLKQRNVIAHGTLARCEGRLLIGSTSLSSRLRADGGSDTWVWIDEMHDYHARCRDALEVTKTLRSDFERAHEKISTET